jgi:hypothetical protein
MDNTLVSKLLIIIDNQRMLMNILKSIENRLDIIEKAIDIPKGTDDDDEEIIVLNQGFFQLD